MFVFSSCENETRLQPEASISQQLLESSGEFKEFAYYYTDFLLHAQLAKSDILSEKYQDFKSDIELLENKDYLIDVELLKIASLYGFQNVEDYVTQNDAFNNAFFALGEKFPKIFNVENREVFGVAISNYLSSIDNTSISFSSLSQRNDEPDFVLRLELSQCRFPVGISQEGPGEFACDGWEANNCQEYWNNCVAREQVEYILSTLNACGVGSIWTQWGTIFQSPPQNSNGIGGYSGLSLLLLSENGICRPIFEPIFYHFAVCDQCVTETQTNCCN